MHATGNDTNQPSLFCIFHDLDLNIGVLKYIFKKTKEGPLRIDN